MSDARAATLGGLPIPRLSQDRRLLTLSFVTLGGGCAMLLVPALLLGIGAIFRSDGWLGAGIVSLFVLIVVYGVAAYGFRYMFFRDAVKIPGAAPRSQIPNAVDTPGVVVGQPEWSIKLATRGSMGKVGRCWIELYAKGIQIWNSDHPEFRWQFAYGDLLQAESVDLVANTKSGEVHQHLARLVVDRPRMAFLFGSHWFRNNDAPVLVTKLRAHNVPTADEEFAT